MAGQNAQARDEGARPLDEDENDDLAQGEGENAQNGTGESKEKQDGNEKGNDADADVKAELELRKQELAQSKKEARTLQRKLEEVNAKLAKLGVGERDDPEDLTKRLQAAEEKAAALLRQNRAAQKIEAVRETLSDEKYAPYAGTVRYIVPTLELDDEADTGPDGRYDPEVLKDAAEAAVKQYVKDNPRTPQRPRDVAPAIGGDPTRNGAAPGGGKDQDELARLAGLGYGVARRFSGNR